MPRAFWYLISPGVGGTQESLNFPFSGSRPRKAMNCVDDDWHILGFQVNLMEKSCNRVTYIYLLSSTYMSVTPMQTGKL